MAAAWPPSFNASRKDPMRIFFDCEFIEDGETIVPLSIGMVDETGLDGLYLVITDVDRTQANDWVAENVLPHLDAPPEGAYTAHVTRREAAEHIHHWISDRTKSPEFWADYCSYDWIVLCQLFGTMMDLPDGWPMFCHDIQQEARRQGVTDLPSGDDDHNAYQDALATWARWLHLTGMGVA